jgi:hypothetical protein
MKKRQMLLAVLFMLALVVAFFPADTQAKKKAKVKLNKTSATLAPGGTVQLKLQNNKKKVKWSSSKTSVATVSSSGLVTGKKAGSATVTAKVGKKKYKCKVTVKNVVVTIPQRGTKTDKIVKYVYKRKGETPKKLDDFEIHEYDSKEKADKVYTADDWDYVGEAVVEMTDSRVTYQNFDTVLEYYTGAHRYNITVSGKATLPAEVVALIKSQDDIKDVLNLYVHFDGYKSRDPYGNDSIVAGGENGYYHLIDPDKYDGRSINTTYDKTAGTFTAQIIEVRAEAKADYAMIYLFWPDGNLDRY